MKNLKNKIMIIVYIIIIGVCAIGGFFGTYKLSQVLSKDDSIKLQHPIPDVLLMDFNFEVKLTDLQVEILEDKIKKKMFVQGGKSATMQRVPVGSFFDTKLFAENNIAELEYKMDKVMYQGFENIHVLGIIKSKDSKTTAYVQTNSNEIVISPHDNLNPSQSAIEVTTYIRETKTVIGKVKNLQVFVTSQSASQYILDLENISLSLSLSMGLKIANISMMKIKSQRTTYFFANDFKKNDRNEYTAKLIKFIY